MKCFKHLNQRKLDLARTKLSNASTNEMFLDLVPGLDQEYSNQKLFNEEYEKSIKEQNLTPRLLSLLVKYKKHNPE